MDVEPHAILHTVLVVLAQLGLHTAHIVAPHLIWTFLLPLARPRFSGLGRWRGLVAPTMRPELERIHSCISRGAR